MKIGDLVRVKHKYSTWDYGPGILLAAHTTLQYRVLFGDSVVLFYKHEIEVLDENRRFD